ncbi:hypothetical protein M9H77_04400 [Catharanthus roseus]|uniref:Uncharacterized protein n=1 Tax=Catharanthus roseus TaxID=4058 RepID=A0ACC0CE96_CATRO|nr:hypothetical protein M9H77_04400 [Catharanthus roseus]
MQKQEEHQHRNKWFFGFQFCLRLLSIGATLAASYLILTSKQITTIFGIVADARYSYSTAFRFFAYANIVACALSLLCFLFLLIGPKPPNVKKCFVMFLHDLIVTILLMGACGAAAAIGYVGKYGESHIGWAAICDNFSKFCNRVILSLVFSFLALIFYLFLTITSANKSRG